MQTGVTGINTIRIYNPVKQSLERDPDGLFIKEWVPELADMPIESLHAHRGPNRPWNAQEVESTYPEPIVSVEAAGRAARKTFLAIQAQRGRTAKKPRASSGSTWRHRQWIDCGILAPQRP